MDEPTSTDDPRDADEAVEQATSGALRDVIEETVRREADADETLEPHLALVRAPDGEPEPETIDPPGEAEPKQADPLTAAADVDVHPKSILEAMLFVGGDPLQVERIAELIGTITANDVREMVQELNEAYDEEGVPFEIAEQKKKGLAIQVTDQYLPIVRRLFVRRRQTGLSKAALESLALVAYRQPATRLEIDAIRGTDSSAHVRNLISRGLVRVVGRSEGGGRSVQYGTTQRFLDQFNLASIDDLPHMSDIEKL